MFQKYSNLVSSGTLWEFPAPSFMIGRCVKSTQLPSYTWTETWLPLLNSLLTFTDWHNLRDSWCMSPEWQISEDSDLRIIVSCMFCHIQNDHEVMDTYYGDTKKENETYHKIISMSSPLTKNRQVQSFCRGLNKPKRTTSKLAESKKIGKIETILKESLPEQYGTIKLQVPSSQSEVIPKTNPNKPLLGGFFLQNYDTFAVFDPPKSGKFVIGKLGGKYRIHGYSGIY